MRKTVLLFALGWDDTLQCIQIMHASRWCRYTHPDDAQDPIFLGDGQRCLLGRKTLWRPFCSLHWDEMTHSSASTHSDDAQDIENSHCVWCALHCTQMHCNLFDFSNLILFDAMVSNVILFNEMVSNEIVSNALIDDAQDLENSHCVWCTLHICTALHSDAL